MTWTIEWVYAILLTSLTGSILYVTWRVVGMLLEKIGFANIIFELLKVVIIFFLLPIGYIALKAKEQEIGRGYLFGATPVIFRISNILLLLWFCGFLFMLVHFKRNVKRNKEWMQNVIPCEPQVVQQFEEIYQSLGGKKGRLEVCRSYNCQVPCVTGWFFRKIILPMEDYSEDELQVILTHEITHHLQGDVALKWVCAFMLCIHYFNPLAWKFYGAIQKWSEFSCDYKASNVVGSLKTYFGVIANIVVERSFETCLSSQLSETANDLIERIDKMKKNHKVKYRSKWAAAIMVAVAFVTSSATVCAATIGSVQQYVKMYHTTEVEYELENDIDLTSGYVEYIEYGNAEGVVEREGETNTLSRSTTSFEWTVASNELVKSDAFVCVPGQTINVNVFISPSDLTMKVGIMRPDGSRLYVTGEGRVMYDFNITLAGVHRVFVENNSSESVEVEGNYLVYTE